MINEILLAAGGVAAMAGVARAGFAHTEAGRARTRIAPAVAALKRRHRHTRRLPPRYRATNDALLEMIVAARDARREIMDRMKVQLPSGAAGAEYLPELEERMERAGVSFFETLRTSYLLKVRNLAVGQVADRFDDRLEILRHARYDLSAMEQRIVDLLDQVGVIDFVENAFELIPEAVRLYAESAADATADGVSDFLHATATVCHVPGLISGTRDAIQELRFLIEDDISLGEAFADGVMPSAIRIVLTKIGVLLDTATGWLSLGLFTIACNWFGKLVGTEILQARLQKQIEIVNGHVETMRRRQRAALAAIRRAVDELIESFCAVVAACPDIGDEPVLKAYFDDLVEAYGQGLAEASHATTRDVAKAVDSLPRRGRLDVLLGVDPANEMTDVLWETQRDLGSHHLGVAHGFAMAREAHAEEAARFLQVEEIFANAATRRALSRSDEVLVTTAVDYAESLTAWEESCRKVWEEGTRKIQEVTAREHAETKAVVDQAMAGIQAARRRIAILRRRLGAEQATA